MNKDDKYLIIYHKEDNDGLFSMAIIFNYLVDVVNVSPENIHRLGADYEILNNIYKNKVNGKTELDQILDRYQHIIMTDISFNDFKAIKKIYKKLGHEFVWIDHHAPVIKQSIAEGLEDIPGERDITKSAILNAFKYCYDPFDELYKKRDKSIELFRILSAFDSWSYEQEGYTKDYAFSVNTAVINKFQLDPEKIIPYVEKILKSTEQSSDIDEYENDGRKFNDSYYAINRKIVDDYGELWDMRYAKGRKAIVIFQSGQTSSMWFEKAKDIAQNGIAFKHLKNGNWGVSLYNTDDNDKSFNCGEYLKKYYGGGGHLGAAGCQLSEEEFLKILKDKKL